MTVTPETDTHRPSDGPLIFARVIDNSGASHPLDWKDVRAWVPRVDGEVLWVHLDREAPAVSQWLTNGLGLSDATVSAHLQ